VLTGIVVRAGQVTAVDVRWWRRGLDEREMSSRDEVAKPQRPAYAQWVTRWIPVRMRLPVPPAVRHRGLPQLQGQRLPASGDGPLSTFAIDVDAVLLQRAPLPHPGSAAASRCGA
jgi:hypothetical protein